MVPAPALLVGADSQEGCVRTKYVCGYNIVAAGFIIQAVRPDR
jgi:hypothetical protein